MTTIPSPQGAPDFKFGDVNAGTAPNSIQAVSKLEPYLVAYKDGEGRAQVRIAFRMPDGRATYLLQEKISGSNVAVATHQWFHKALSKKLQVDEGSAESI
jgi:hypothetical protein